MISALFVYALFAFALIIPSKKPAFGVVALYGWICLDPAWNWRWALYGGTGGVRFQFYIFLSLVFFLMIHGFPFATISKHAKVILLGLLGLYFWTFASSITSISPADSAFFMRNYWRVIALAGVGILSINSDTVLRYLMIAVSLGATYNCYQLNLDYFEYGFCRWAKYGRWGTFALDNNTFTICLLPCFAITIAIAFFEKRRVIHYCALAGVVLQAHVIMMFLSRGGMLGAISTLVSAIIYLPNHKLAKRAIFATCLAGFFLAGPSIVEEFTSSFAAEDNRDASAQSRLNLWSAGWAITNDNPILGVGPHAPRRIVAQHIEGLDTDNKAIHNLFLDTSAASGIPALILLLVTLITSYRYCSTTYNRQTLSVRNAARYAVIIGIPGYCASSMFSSVPLSEQGYLLLVIAASVANLELMERRANANKLRLSPNQLQLETTPNV